jgi:ABC-type uncharacterized transport system permease subunit
MYLTQERDLKLHKKRALLAFLPPITRLEMITRALLLAGFVLLTSALIVSAIFMQQQGQPLTADFKILWSIFVWGLYLALILMRWKFWRGGRRFAWGSIAAFAFVLLTFWGSSLMSPLHRP